MSGRALQTPAEALKLSVRMTDKGHYIIENSHFRLANFDEEYVSLSGYCGKHNPHVFAAAPELLEACENWINWLKPDAPWREDAVDYEAKMLDAMRAAIAKARGEQS